MPSSVFRCISVFQVYFGVFRCLQRPDRSARTTTSKMDFAWAISRHGPINRASINHGRNMDETWTNHG